MKFVENSGSLISCCTRIILMTGSFFIRAFFKHYSSLSAKSSLSNKNVLHNSYHQRTVVVFYYHSYFDRAVLKSLLNLPEVSKIHFHENLYGILLNQRGVRTEASMFCKVTYRGSTRDFPKGYIPTKSSSYRWEP